METETEPTPTCEHCGQPDEFDAQHRGCRMKAAFPGAYHEDGVLVSFDMAAIKKTIGYHDPVETRSGISFQRDGTDIYAGVEIQVGNQMSAWDWHITGEEWDAIVAALAATGEAA